MFRSGLDSKKAIGCVLIIQIMKLANQEALINIADTIFKDYSTFQWSWDWKFWSQSAFYKPILEVFATFLTYIESDTCLISMAGLTFAFIYKFIAVKCANLAPLVPAVKKSILLWYREIC